MNLFVPDVNQGSEELGESKISLCYLRGLRASPQSFRTRGGMVSCVCVCVSVRVCGVFVDD